MLILLILLLCDFDCCVLFLSSLVNVLRNFGSPLTSTGSLAVPMHATLLLFVAFLWTFRGRRSLLVVRPVTQDDTRADAHLPRHLLEVENEIFEPSSNWTIGLGKGARPSRPLLPSPSPSPTLSPALAAPARKYVPYQSFHRWANAW